MASRWRGAPVTCKVYLRDRSAQISLHTSTLQYRKIDISPTHCMQALSTSTYSQLSPRLCPSTAGRSPPSMSSTVFCLLLSSSRVVPSFLVMSSCHLLLGRPLDLFFLLGCHSVQRLFHLLSFILAICPAHLHFYFSLYSIKSMIFVLFQISEHGILSCSFRPNIFLSIAL